jgi:melibiose permease/lactose/raffinose/galactose permease
MNKKRSKWSYAIGCTGRDMCYTLVSMYLLIYIQYSGLLNEAQFLVLTGIIVLCRVWDAVNDPMMGTIISNTKTRLGKYRPWVLIGCLSNAIFLILLFTLRFDNGWVNVIVLGVTYLLWGMTYTMNDVSYWSLLPALSEDKEDRDKLT